MPSSVSGQPEPHSTAGEHIAALGAAPAGSHSSVRRVVVASSLGAIFESYDLALFGPLAAIISTRFFANLDATSAYVFTLLSFGVAYVVRPLGALVFGRMGDRVGRKYSFLATITILGSATVLIGLLPTYATVGLIAPVLMMILRVLQGLAFGGEFGSAVSYIAEYARTTRRGLATGAFVITAACGLALAILVVLATEMTVGQSAFERWGWRVPFLFGGVLMFVSAYMRRRLQESPLFVALRTQGSLSADPLREAFATRRYLPRAVLATLGAVAGSSVATAVGAYPIYFLMLNLRIDPFQLHYTILGYSVLYIAFLIGAAALSDRVGRKPLMVAGFVTTALACFPVFKAITHYADPALETAAVVAPIRVLVNPSECSAQLDPVGVRTPHTSCDIAHRALAKAAVPYATIAAPEVSTAQVAVGAVYVTAFDGQGLDVSEYGARTRAFERELRAALASAGYPSRAAPDRTNVVALIALLALLNLFVAMAAGPLAAWLVEMFPTRIRDSATAVSYNIGVWFGGFLPTIVFTVFTLTGNFYSGLWYAVLVLLCSSVICVLCLPETRGRPLGAID
jgi:MFS family permease